MVNPRAKAADAGKEPPDDDLPAGLVDEGPMRSELLRQIAYLEGELTSLAIRYDPWEPRSTNPLRGPAVLSTAELEAVRDELYWSLQGLNRRTLRLSDVDAPAASSGRARPRGRVRRLLGRHTGSSQY